MRSRFTELGADPEKVFVTGNLKFDWRPPVRQEELVKNARRLFKTGGLFFCVAGSTHEGEEEILFKTYVSLKARHPEFRLMIAPRHLDRLPSIESQASKAGVPVKRVSSFERNGDFEFASGGFLELHPEHTREDMGRAVVESIAFGIRRVLFALEENGCPVDELRVTGGQARNVIWNQLKADVLGHLPDVVTIPFAADGM